MDYAFSAKLFTHLTQDLNDHKIISSKDFHTQKKQNFIIRFFKSLIYPFYDCFKEYRSNQLLNRISKECQDQKSLDGQTFDALKNFLQAFNAKTHRRHALQIEEILRTARAQSADHTHQNHELKTAMMLFRNEHPGLAKLSSTTPPFSSFLAITHEVIDQASPLKATFAECLEIQKELEKETCDTSMIVNRITAQLHTLPPGTSFQFPGLLHHQGQINFFLFDGTKMSEEELQINFHQKQVKVPLQDFLAALPAYFQEVNASLLRPQAQSSSHDAIDSPTIVLISHLIHQGLPQQAKKPSLQKTTQQFLKVHFNEGFRAFQEIRKVHVLLLVLAKHPEWKNQPDWRHWVKGCLKNLNQKRLGDLPQELRLPYQTMQQKVYFLQQEVLAADKIACLPTLPNASQESLSTIFDLQLDWSPVVEYLGHEAATEAKTDGAKIAGATRPEHYPDIANNDHPGMQQWVDYLGALLDKKEFDELDFEATQLLLQLPSPDVFSKLEDAEIWTPLFTQAATLLLHAHFVLERPTLPPARTLGVIKILDICQHLWKGAKFGGQQGINQFAFADHYHNLSFYGAEIVRSLHSLYEVEQKGKNPAPPIPMKELNRLNDLTDLLAFALMPQAFIFDGYQRSKKTPEALAAEYADFYDRLQIGKAKLSEGALLEIVRNGPELRIEPFSCLLPKYSGSTSRENLALRFISEEFYHPPRTPYFTQDFPIKNSEIRLRVAEGSVTEMTRNLKLKRSHRDFACWVSQPYTGISQTQRETVLEKFKFDQVPLVASTNLILNQSGTFHLTSNTFYTFAEAVYLFSLEKEGKDWQQVFKLNIFANGGLYRELVKNPDQAFYLFLKMEEMIEIAQKSGDQTARLFLLQCYAEMVEIARKSPLKSDRMQELEQRLLNYLTSLRQAIETSGNPLREVPSLRTLLHCYAHSPSLDLDPSTLVMLAKITFLLSPRLHQLIESEMDRIIIIDFTKVLNRRLLKMVENNPGLLDEVIAYRYPQPKEPRKWQRVDESLVWISGLIRIDLAAGKAYTALEKDILLPFEIRNDPRFLTLFGKNRLNKKYKLQRVKTPLGDVWRTTLSKKGMTYALYMKTGDPQFPLLFRQNQEQWEQLCLLNSDSSPSHDLPIDFSLGYFWNTTRAAHNVIEDGDQKKSYQFETRPSGVTLHLFEGDQTKPVYNPWGNAHYAIFQALDDPSKIRFFQGDWKGALTTVCQYLDIPLKYFWDQLNTRWECSNLAGFYLSQKPIEHWHQADSVNDQPKSVPHFFRTDFKHYHILENEVQKGKLILFYQPYSKHPQEAEALNSYKYADLLIPDRSQTDIKEMAIFDLDFQQDLKSKKPQDYLYLAYVLFTQKKYERALAYLEKSHQVWVNYEETENQTMEKVQTWFLEWEDPSSHGIAVKTHLLLQLITQVELKSATGSEVLKNYSQELKLLMATYETYQEHEPRISLALRLNQHQKDDLRFIAPMVTSWVSQTIQDIGKMGGKERTAYLSKRLLTEETISFYRFEPATPDSNKLINHALDLEIAFHQQQIPHAKPIKKLEVVKDFAPQPLLNLQAWLSPLRQRQSEMKLQVDTLILELHALFPGNTHADLMGQMLLSDLEDYAKKVHESSVIDLNSDLNALVTQLHEQEKNLKKTEQKLEKHLKAQFLFKPHSMDQALVFQLEEQEKNPLHLFERAKYSFATNDWSTLLKSGVLTEAQIPAFQESMRHYFVTRTDRKMLTRKREGVEELLRNKEDNVVHQTVSQQVQEWRQYDPFLHPLSTLFLVFEDELNLTIRKNQVDHCHKLSEAPNVFVHEAMAGGKTSLLRNIFCAIQAQHGKLAGVMTYSPLMQMHHRELADVNSKTLGALAFPLIFSRDKQKDPAAFKILLLQHLKALNRKGRIDQIPKAILSLKHALTEMVLQLGTQDTEQQRELRQVLSVLQDILTLRQSYLALYSDEMDKNCNSRKYYNYSYGENKILTKQFYQPGLDILMMLLANPAFQPLVEVLRAQKLKVMPVKEFEHYIALLAQDVCLSLKVKEHGLDEAQTMAYLTETYREDRVKQREITNYYHQNILPSPLKESLQIFHSYIGVLFRNMHSKECGVDYGRSGQDGLTVKPYAFSAQCQENSQRSFVLSTVIETCFDYLVNQTHAGQMGTYLLKKKEKALDEMSAENLCSIDETKTGKFVLEHFEVLLSTVTKKDYQKISETINRKPALLVDFLERVIFQDYTYYEQKIEGNAHHFANEMREFSGASGSPERVFTLPGFINKLPELIRQKGAIGSVLYNLLVQWKESESFKFLQPESRVSLPQQIAANLKEGDVFIDNVPLFPGQTGLSIAQKLAEAVGAKSSQQSPYRYLDQSDKVCVLENGAIRSEVGINLAKVRSIIPHQGVQGTDWKFAVGTKGILGLSPDSGLTDSLQAAMRIRGLGERQGLMIMADPAIQDLWKAQPQLEGKSLLASTIWLWIQNEVKASQMLNFQSNTQGLKAFGNSLVDRLFREIKDPRVLIALKSLPSIEKKSISTSVLHPDQLGIPSEISESKLVLEELQKREIASLKDMLQEIKTLPLPQAEQALCLTIVEDGIQHLSQAHHLLDELLLPATVSVPATFSDDTEELEVEADQQAEVQQMEEQQTELEMEMQLEIEAEQQGQTEIDLRRKRPTKWDDTYYEDGLSQIEKGLFANLKGNLSLAQYPPLGFPPDVKLFPQLVTSCHVMGFQPIVYKNRLGSLVNPSMELVQNAVWVYGKAKIQVTLSPKVLIAVYQGMVVLSTLTVHTADNFYGFIIKVQAEKNPECQFWEWDLREKHLPSLKNEKEMEQLKELILYAKILYADIALTADEKQRFSAWIDRHKLNPKDLEKALTSYLEKYYPGKSENNDFLKVIQSKK